MKKNIALKLITALLTFAIGVSSFSVVTNTKLEKVHAATTLANPIIKSDITMASGQAVTYDCVWFGSYPQAEVIPSKNDYEDVRFADLQDYDLIEDSALYEKLQSLTDWDENNDIVYQGNKYRRVGKATATYISSNPNGYGKYNWNSSVGVHYFKYEPIKWRVLSVDGNEAILLSNICLDTQKYNDEKENITWENCSLRNWLNNSFKNTAFNAAEQNAILVTTVKNDDNLSRGTDGGNDTEDSLYLLSESEVYNTDTAVNYGFSKDPAVNDEARQFKSSTYAKAMGLRWEISSYLGMSYSTWLRSPGKYAFNASCIKSEGTIFLPYFVNENEHGVCPVLKMNLSSSKNYFYAGTVSTNGTVNEIPCEVKKITTKNSTIKLSEKTFTYDGKAKNPTVEVYDENGKLIEDKYYTLSYKNNKKVGKATLTIKFKNKYSGTIKANYKIIPKATTVTSAKFKDKKAVITWKKQSTQITGYQIQIATDKKFTQGKKSYTVTKPKQTSMKISGLKKNKKYYFRIRTYKTVNGKKYYSSWSKTTSVVVK